MPLLLIFTAISGAAKSVSLLMLCISLQEVVVLRRLLHYAGDTQVMIKKLRVAITRPVHVMLIDIGV